MFICSSKGNNLKFVIGKEINLLNMYDSFQQGQKLKKKNSEKVNITKLFDKIANRADPRSNCTFCTIWFRSPLVVKSSVILICTIFYKNSSLALSAKGRFHILRRLCHDPAGRMSESRYRISQIPLITSLGFISVCSGAAWAATLYFYSVLESDYGGSHIVCWFQATGLRRFWCYASIFSCLVGF